MYGAAKSMWLILIAVMLVAFANVALKVRVTALGGGPLLLGFRISYRWHSIRGSGRRSSLQLVPDYFMLFPCGNSNLA